MTTEVATQTSPALALKGGLFTLTAIQLYRLDLEAIAQELDSKIKQAPNFFQNTPIVLDLSGVASWSQDTLNALITLFKSKQLIPVGLRGIQNASRKIAIDMGLAILPESKSTAAVSSTTASTSTSSPEQKSVTDSESDSNSNANSDSDLGDSENRTLHQTTSSRLFTNPIRSGQQVYAPGGDLVILSSVSHGAELLAEGHIHVHGALRGRALAGINGDQNAIIYCKSLEAELVSIAGQYKISEDLKESDLWKRSVCIRLKDNRLQVEAL